MNTNKTIKYYYYYPNQLKVWEEYIHTFKLQINHFHLIYTYNTIQ